MLRVFCAASLAALLVGCASQPKQVSQPQVNRMMKADKHAAPKMAAPAEAATPNQIVKKRWYDRFRVHPKWFHSK